MEAFLLSVLYSVHFGGGGTHLIFSSIVLFLNGGAPPRIPFLARATVETPYRSRSGLVLKRMEPFNRPKSALL